MKGKKSRVRKIELDAEVVADLEATDADTGAIQGGGRGNPVSGAARG